MEFWKTPEAQEAEEEFSEMADQFQAEVPTFVPVVSGPTNVPITPSISAPQISASLSVPVSSSMGVSSDPSLREMQEQVSALQNHIQVLQL